MGKDGLQITRISGAGAFIIRRPYHMQGRCVSCEGFDLDGKRLAQPIWHDADNETRIVPEDRAMRFVLRFGPQTMDSNGRAAAKPGRQEM
jgi:hypothetical protein